MKAFAPRSAAAPATAAPSGKAVAPADNRPATVAQRQLQATIAASPRQAAPVQLAAPRRNTTGLPDQLKAGVESLSGHSLDDVKVHYNSAKPAQLQALAYAQGTDIHLGPGQEKHLPHEAWHVVQQKQGRVRATRQLKGAAVNSDKNLESEADSMGNKSSVLISNNNIEDVRERNRTNQAEVSTNFNASSKVYQLALPPNEWKVVGYNARKNKQAFDGDNAKPKFSTGFKSELLKEWNDSNSYGITTSKGENKQYVRTVTDSGKGNDMFHNWVPFQAFQIDHIKSWDSIKSALLRAAKNKTILYANAKKKTPAIKLSSFLHGWENDAYTIDKSDKIHPTKYAARMYYHDFNNLRPMQGSENASKGKKNSANNSNQNGDKIIKDKQISVEKGVTNSYLTIIDSIQNAYHHVVVKNDKSLLAKLSKVWDEKSGPAIGALKEAANQASSTNTGAPPTPDKTNTK